MRIVIDKALNHYML